MIPDKILLAHHQEVYLHGLFHKLEKKYQNISTVQTGIEALHTIIEDKPAVALLDVDLPMLSAFDIMRTASDRDVKTKFIVIFPSVQHEYLVAAHSWKVSGTLNVKDRFKSVFECIECVLNGTTYFSQEEPTGEIELIHDILKSVNSLSETEKQVLCLIGEHHGTSEIAIDLGISKRTIEKHRSNIINKLRLDKKTNSLTNWVMKNEQLVKTLKFSIST